MSLFIDPDDEAYVMPPVYTACLAWLATLPDDTIRPPIAPAAGFLADNAAAGEETAFEIVEMLKLFLDDATAPFVRLLLSEAPLLTTPYGVLHRQKTGLQPAWYTHNEDDRWTLDEDIVIYIVYDIDNSKLQELSKHNLEDIAEKRVILANELIDSQNSSTQFAGFLLEDFLDTNATQTFATKAAAATEGKLTGALQHMQEKYGQDYNAAIHTARGSEEQLLAVLRFARKMDDGQGLCANEVFLFLAEKGVLHDPDSDVSASLLRDLGSDDIYAHYDKAMRSYRQDRTSGRVALWLHSYGAARENAGLEAHVRDLVNFEFTNVYEPRQQIDEYGTSRSEQEDPKLADIRCKWAANGDRAAKLASLMFCEWPCTAFKMKASHYSCDESSLLSLRYTSSVNKLEVSMPQPATVIPSPTRFTSTNRLYNWIQDGPWTVMAKYKKKSNWHRKASVISDKAERTRHIEEWHREASVISDKAD